MILNRAPSLGTFIGHLQQQKWSSSLSQVTGVIQFRLQFFVMCLQQSEGELDLREQYLQRLRELVTLQLRYSEPSNLCIEGCGSKSSKIKKVHVCKHAHARQCTLVCMQKHARTQQCTFSLASSRAVAPCRCFASMDRWARLSSACCLQGTRSLDYWANFFVHLSQTGSIEFYWWNGSVSSSLLIPMQGLTCKQTTWCNMGSHACASDNTWQATVWESGRDSCVGATRAVCRQNRV